MNSPIGYMYIHKILAEQTVNKGPLKKKDVLVVLTRRFSFPKAIAWSVFKEMEALGLLLVTSRYLIEIKGKSRLFHVFNCPNCSNLMKCEHCKSVTEVEEQEVRISTPRKGNLCNDTSAMFHQAGIW